MNNRHNLIAYLATLFAITALAIVAAFIIRGANLNSEVAVAKLIGALAFISGAIQGLTGVIGTFKASQSSGMSDDTAKQILNKVPPTTEGEPA